MALSLADIARFRWVQVKEQGWDTHSFGEECAIIHAEVSELFEACAVEPKPIHRPVTWYSENHKPKGIPSELADIIIKTCGLAEKWGINLNDAVAEKLTYNATREYKHSW